jgi:hypothetical protein
MGYIHFFDDWQLISYSNLKRMQGKPKYVPEATLEDELCEGCWDFPLVARLPESGKYVGLYGAAPATDEIESYDIPEGTDQNVLPRSPIICYTESEDGIHWKKPDLTGKAKFEGPVRAKNQVFGVNGGVEGGPAYFDPYESDPHRRFKLLINYLPAKGKSTKACRALAVSRDGISWKLGNVFADQEATDTPTSVFYNPLRKSYVFNVRRYNGDRRIFFFETKDWVNFTEPELIMHPGPLDPPLVGFYGMPVIRYETLFIGLLWRILCDPNTHMLPNGSIDCDLAYSYDGEHFNRTFHNAFIDRNELGCHGGGCIYVASMLVDENNQIRFYSGGSRAEHYQNQNLTDAALMLHTLRLDGFVYMATPAGKGYLRTRPLCINGPDLRINARSPYGGIRVRVLDEKGVEIPGYGFNDCVPLLGDELFWTPRWKGGKTVAGVKSHKRRQFEIEIVTGEIYAIRGDFELLKSLWTEDCPD